jgi:hypothetical protein
MKNRRGGSKVRRVNLTRFGKFSRAQILAKFSGEEKSHVFRLFNRIECVASPMLKPVSHFLI